ncbi:hypothetical protein, partial [Pseudomonas viridiflava]|uniref:hypothetical protein n=1 Tax=Pseudomonas viridiflava TaxID=33069 RepID=UPI001CA9AC85
DWMSLDIQSGLMQERSVYGGPNRKFRVYSAMLRRKIQHISHRWSERLVMQSFARLIPLHYGRRRSLEWSICMPN